MSGSDRAAPGAGVRGPGCGGHNADITCRMSNRYRLEEVTMMTLKNILVATDFGEAAEAALAYGRAFASRFGATLHVLHVAQNVYLGAGAEGFVAIPPTLQEDIVEG